MSPRELRIRGVAHEHAEMQEDRADRQAADADAHGRTAERMDGSENSAGHVDTRDSCAAREAAKEDGAAGVAIVTATAATAAPAAPAATAATAATADAAVDTTASTHTLPAYLRPPPRVAGAEWGLGRECADNVDAALAARVAHLTSLKHERGIHFNVSLARNRAFHNPRIYEKLVKWAGLDDTGTNHPACGTGWDPHDPQVVALGNATRLAAALHG
ncbi:hypothetical protein MCUN1_002159 [Malassezia cuniculi]|uniref:HCNGP-like protein n=1 Tax=Malassezia cuniculi TaxID=948313 RepID=A0AAF0J6K1_9BASI|nr:hypothetical protein MCUN1_002159 [Malassezia cuniculi]